MLVTYMTDTDEPVPETYFWEATFSAFANEVTFLPLAEVREKDVSNSEVIVFIGNEGGTVPKTFRNHLKEYKGKIIAFGYNAEQLPAFDQWQFLGETQLRALDGESLSTSLTVMETIPPEQSDVLSVGESLDEEIPFISQYKNAAYIATTQANLTEKLAVSRNIYDLLEIDPPKGHPAYIRLEDVTPLSDLVSLQEAGDYLVERDIPFYISLNPIYENKQTGEYRTLAENEALVDVLRDLQDGGGMLIVHGYTKSYLPNEGEDGYEFWDIELNQKITSVNPANERTPLLSQAAFASKEAYDTYMDEVNEVEKVYIEDKLTKAIEELVALKLYPISFEPPHYAMSLSGYAVSSQYFSSVFGHLQLSDRDATVTNVPLFVTSPAVTSRMTVYPETIGFVDMNVDAPLEEMEKSIRQLENVPGAMIGGFYHAYLGTEYLPELVALIESVGIVEWLDLRETSEFVRTERVEILQQGEGTSFHVTKERVGWTDLWNELKNHPLEVALWSVSGIVLLFLFAFFLYIVRLRVQLRKRLFEERETNG